MGNRLAETLPAMIICGTMGSIQILVVSLSRPTFPTCLEKRADESDT